MKRKRRSQPQRMSLSTFHQADFVRVVELLMQVPGRIGQAVRMASEGIAWRLSCAEQAAEWGRAPYLQRLSVLVDAAQRMGDVNPWTPYSGSRGGHGWRHGGTGDIRYQTDRPAAHETGGDAESQPKVTNESHVAAFQQGHKPAAEALLKQNAGLVYNLAKRYARHPDDMEDLQQEARIALLHAAKAFDPARGFQFSTLATKVIGNHLARITGRAGKRKSVWNQNPEDKEGQQVEPSVDPDELPMEQDEQKSAVLDAIDALPDRFKTIVQRRYGLDGKPPESSTEIAAKIGLSKQRVSQMLQYAEEKMRGGLQEWATRLSADANPWMPYHGPRGGIGWRHGGTGDVRYGGERPGAGETGSGKAAETGGKTTTAEHAPAEGVDQLERRLTDQYQDDIEDLSLSQPHGKSIHIHNIRMKPGRTGRGVGSKVIRAIQEYATANDLPITLNSEPDQKKKAALEAFYHANGFQRPGRARDYSLTQHTHIWRPRFGMAEAVPDEHDRRALHPSKLKVPDKLPGGKADGLPDSAFDPGALAAGTKQEMEHTKDPAIAKEIAKDGLVEDPEMYDDRRAVGAGKLTRGEKATVSLPSTTKEAAEVIAASMAELIAKHPEFYRDPPPTEQIAKNWAKNLKGRMEGVRPKTVQLVGKAIEDNTSNPVFQQVVKANHQSATILLKADAGHGHAGESIAGVSFIYDSLLMDKEATSTKPPEPGQPTASNGVAATLRHEYAHTLYTHLAPDAKQRILAMLPGEDEVKRGLSMYAKRNKEETFCELFATVTDKHYQADKFPRWVQDAGAELLRAVTGGPVRERHA